VCSLSPNLDIRTWFQNVEQHATEGVHKILIGNKCDWEEKREVSTEKGEDLARELGIPFIETSAKSNVNVEKAFYQLAQYPRHPPSTLLTQREIKQKLVGSAAPGSTNANVNLDSNKKSLGGGCCS